MALVMVIIEPGNGAPTTPTPPSSDGGALTPELQSLHEAPHDTAPAPIGAMSLRTVLRRPGALKWVVAFDKERIDLASTFADDRPPRFRVRRSEVSTDAIVLNSLVTSCVSRAGKQKSMWVVGESRRPGEERDVGASSPTCIASSVLLVFPVAAHKQVRRDTVRRRRGVHARRVEPSVLRPLSTWIRGVPHTTDGRRAVRHECVSSSSRQELLQRGRRGTDGVRHSGGVPAGDSRIEDLTDRTVRFRTPHIHLGAKNGRRA